MLLLNLFILLGTSSCRSKIIFPEYMVKCSRSDPKLSTCIKESANKAISHIGNGDKAYRIPNLKPLIVNEIVSEPTKDFKIVMKNCKSYGIDECSIKDADINLDKKTWSLDVLIPRWELIADYDINGRLLILNIKGSGFSNFTTINGIYHYKMNYDFRDGKDGKKYIQIKDSNVAMTVERVYSHMDNLFGGDERLGKEVNKILNENWKEFHEELKPTIEATVAEVVTSIINGVFSTVPYEDILLP